MDDQQKEEPGSAQAPKPCNDEQTKSNAEGAPCDGRIPPELRQQILQHFAQFDDSLYDEIDEEKCLELGEFLDLEYWEREAALEQAKRKR